MPASVRWVTNQNGRWGSCTPADRTIRISHRIQDMPDWVIDYVLLHELAHLIVPSHNARVLGAGRPLPEGRTGPRLPGGGRRRLRRPGPRLTPPAASAARLPGLPKLDQLFWAQVAGSAGVDGTIRPTESITAPAD